MCSFFGGCFGIVIRIWGLDLHAAVPDIRDLEQVACAPIIDQVVADHERAKAGDLQPVRSRSSARALFIDCANARAAVGLRATR